MPSLAAAQAANAAYSPTYLPVAIFVGGTSGIGRATASAFARHTRGNAHIIIVGRNAAAAEELIASFPTPSASASMSGAKHEFVKCDVSLMRGIADTTASLRARVPKVNFLVLSAGALNLRVERTEEGVDRRLGLHYYSRWMWVREMLPSLRVAGERGEEAGVMSVLAWRRDGPVDLGNLGLERRYSVWEAGKVSPAYTELMFEHHARENPDIAFVHISPGLVDTPLVRFSHWALRPLNVFMTLVATSAEDCGEYMLYGLLQSDRGVFRRDSRGEDVGKTRYRGTDEERERVWEHSEEVVERALNASVQAQDG